MGQALLLDRDIVKLFELVLISGAVLGVIGWQIMSVRASIRADRERVARERTKGGGGP